MMTPEETMAFTEGYDMALEDTLRDVLKEAEHEMDQAGEAVISLTELKEICEFIQRSRTRERLG